MAMKPIQCRVPTPPCKCGVKGCHKVWGISKLNDAWKRYADFSEYDDNYNRRKGRVTPPVPFLPRPTRFSKKPMESKSAYREAYVHFLKFEPRESEKREYKTSVVNSQKNVPIEPIPYKYNPIGTHLRSVDKPGLTYYQSDYLRMSPKVMRWCKDHKLPPPPNNLNIPRSKPMEKRSVNTMAYVRHPQWAYYKDTDKMLVDSYPRKVPYTKKQGHRCAHKISEQKKSTYRPETEKPKKKPLCKCSDEVLMVHNEDILSQQNDGKTSPHPSQNPRSSPAKDDYKPVPKAAPVASDTPICTEELQANERVERLREQEDAARRASGKSPGSCDSRSTGTPPSAIVRCPASPARETHLPKSASPVSTSPKRLSRAKSPPTTGVKSPMKPEAPVSSPPRSVAHSLSPERASLPYHGKPLTKSDGSLDLPRFIHGRPLSHESDVSITLASRMCEPYGPYGEYILPSDCRPQRPTPEEALGTSVTRPPHGTGTAWYPMDLMINPKLGIFIGNAAH